jgi:hypothetical protein
LFIWKPNLNSIVYLYEKTVPKNFREKAALAAIYLIINRLPSRVLGLESPVDVLPTF